MRVRLRMCGRLWGKGWVCPSSTGKRGGVLYCSDEVAQADGGRTRGGEGETVARRDRAGASRAVRRDQSELVFGGDGASLRAAGQSVLAGALSRGIYGSAARARGRSGVAAVRVRGDEHGVAGDGGGG